MTSLQTSASGGKRFQIADLFCGAGGTSTGAVEAIRALGMRPELTACNHWPVAVATHTANHPDARHFCASLDTLNPRELFAPGELRLLWGSPECTNHSRARRGKHINEQSRATAWCVTRWADALRPDTVLIENVPEFRNWPSFAAWVACLESFGYRVDSRILVAADYGDPTTRRRLFVQAVRGKRRIVWPDATHGKDSAMLGLKPWVPSRACIDLTLPAQRIADRKRKLAPRTIARVEEGLRKFGGKPFLVCMEHGGRIVSTDEPFPTITCAKGGAMAICEPFLIEYYGTGGARSLNEPFATITCRDRFALVIPEVGGCRLRMVAGKEYAAGQGFRADYKFTGNGSEITKQIGNAVPRRLARAIVFAAVGQNSNVSELMNQPEAA